MTVGIVGLGLIGGSIGLALRNPSRRIVGYDPSADAARTAFERQCVDELTDFDCVAQADVVFVASPPAATVDVLQQISERRSSATAYTDCTSTKHDVIEWAEARRDARFVAGHPMAGHEKSGAGYASSWLFRGAKWIVSPFKWTDRGAVTAVERLVKEMGALGCRMDARVHDRQVAIVSHLPHVIASAMVTVGDELESVEVAGGSWRDLTRVGGVDPELWSQIMHSNREELLRAIALFQGHLSELRQALESDDRDDLRTILERSKGIKDRQSPPTKPPERSARTVARSKMSRRKQ
jgi:prephenate dehydrogenase